MKQYNLTVTMKLRGPIISAASLPGGFGVDKPIARNALGQCVIPGTHLKGRLREALDNLKTVQNAPLALDKWFGLRTRSEEEQPEEDDQRNIPRRGRLRFDDLTAPSGSPDQRYRISIDPETGAVREGAHLVTESPFSSGEEVYFSGNIHFLADEEENQLVKEWLDQGLRWIPAVCAQRSVGFGQVIGVETQLSVVDSQPTTVGSTGEAFRIALEPQAPFCLATHKISGNIFESASVIAGGVIKGGLATTLNQLLGRELRRPIENITGEWKPLADIFDRIRITHAMPVKSELDSRPRAVPLSLAAFEGSDELLDLSACAVPVLINGKAPIFQSDWKGPAYLAARRRYGWDDELRSQLRVRTAIDSAKGRAADEMLFAYEMIDPTCHKWLAEIVLPEGLTEEQRKEVAPLLSKLLSIGITHLGKTKVSCKIAVVEELPEPEPGPGPWTVVLQTPAWMLPCDADLNQALIDPNILLEAYGEYFRQVSNRIRLSRFFARQELAGGEYLSRRFGLHDDLPYLLTSTGSVFVLEGGDGEPDIRTWLRTGLPLPEWAKEETWNTCPYVPQNGFGEIAIYPAQQISADVKELS